jgi:hypothetical protein
MIPVSKATLKTVNRFPELYKRQALQVIDHEQSEAIRMTADSFVMAAMIALIEEFEFGTTPNSTRIGRFIAKLQEVIDTNAEYYDNAVVEGLHNKLHALGIDYNLR